MMNLYVVLKAVAADSVYSVDFCNFVVIHTINYTTSLHYEYRFYAYSHRFGKEEYK